MNKIIHILVLCLFLPLSLSANKAVADSAYLNQQYDTAIQQYEHVLSEGPNSTVYYNLGNAYYQSGDTVMAILNYERALYLDPFNEDAKFNLNICQNRLGISEQSVSEMYIFDKFVEFVVSRSASFWAWMGFLCAVLFTVCYLLHRFTERSVIVRIASLLSVMSLVASLIFNVFSIWAKVADNSEKKNVLMQSTYLYANPNSSAKQVREIKAGTTLLVVETTNSGWSQVELPGGESGWISAEMSSVIPFAEDISNTH